MLAFAAVVTSDVSYKDRVKPKEVRTPLNPWELLELCDSGECGVSQPLLTSELPHSLPS